MFRTLYPSPSLPYYLPLTLSRTLPSSHSLSPSLSLPLFLSLSFSFFPSPNKSLSPSILYVYLSDVRGKISAGGNYHWLRRGICEPSGRRGKGVSCSLLLLASPLISAVFGLAG